MEPLRYTVPPEQEGITLHTLLRRELNISSTLLKRLKQQKSGILVNSAPAAVTAVLHPGDKVTVDIADPPAELSFAPVELPLSLCYEDEYLLILDKPAGLAVHPSTLDLSQPSLASGLAYYLGGSTPIHPVNRLDRGTTGLMIVAKCSYIHRQLMDALLSGALRREYLAVAEGMLSPPAGLISLPIGRDPDSVIRRRIDPEGVSAVTEYETIRVCRQRSLLRLCPKTGRTHQLRLHLSAVGHPLVGDWLYGTEDRRLISRPALHSARLWLTHPMTGEVLYLQSPMPEDMAQLL